MADRQGDGRQQPPPRREQECGGESYGDDIDHRDEDDAYKREILRLTSPSPTRRSSRQRQEQGSSASQEGGHHQQQGCNNRGVSPHEGPFRSSRNIGEDGSVTRGLPGAASVATMLMVPGASVGDEGDDRGASSPVIPSQVEELQQMQPNDHHQNSIHKEVLDGALPLPFASNDGVEIVSNDHDSGEASGVVPPSPFSPSLAQQVGGKLGLSSQSSLPSSNASGETSASHFSGSRDAAAEDHPPPMVSASAVPTPPEEFVLVPRSSLLLVSHSDVIDDGDGNPILVLRDEEDDAAVTAVPIEENDDEIRRLQETVAHLQEQLLAQNDIVQSLRSSLLCMAAPSSLTEMTTTSTNASTSVSTAANSSTAHDASSAKGDDDDDPSNQKPNTESRMQLSSSSFHLGSKQGAVRLMLGTMLLVIVALVIALVLILAPANMSQLASDEYNFSPSLSPTSTYGIHNDTLMGSMFPTVAPAPTASPYPTVLLEPGTAGNVPESSNNTGDAAISTTPPPTPDLSFALTSAPTPSSPGASSRGALSVGAKVSIAVGVAVVALFLVVSAFLSTRRRRTPAPAGLTSAAIPQGHSALFDETKSSGKPSAGQSKHDDIKRIVGQIDRDSNDWSSDRFSPECLRGGEAAPGSRQRSALLQAQIAALQARVARRSEQAHQLAALLAQRQQQHDREQPPGEDPHQHHSGLEVL